MLCFPLPATDRELFLCIRPASIGRLVGGGSAVSNSLRYYLSDIRAEVARRGGAWNEFLRYTNPLELVHSHVDARRGQLPRAYFEMVELAAFFDLAPAAPAAPAMFCVSLAGRGALDALAMRRGGRPDDLYADLDLPPTAPLSLATLVSLRAVYAGSVDIITADSSLGVAAPDLWCQIAHALCLQKKGGSLVVRICDVFTHTAVDVLALLASCYASVVVAKPQVCDSTSSDKYVVCRGFVFDKCATLYDILCASLAPAESCAGAPDAARVASDARVLSCAASLHFSSHVGVCNAVMGQRQIEAMHAALLLIDGAAKPFRLGGIAESNRRRCAEWCERHALPVAGAPAYPPPAFQADALQGEDGSSWAV